MALRRRLPENAVTVRTYPALEEYVMGFTREIFNLLLVVGEPGLQKTRLVRDTLNASGRPVL